MKFVTSSSSTIGTPIEYMPLEYVPVEYVYVENSFRRSSPCDNCPNNPAVNKFATGVCHCTLNLPDIY